MMQSSLYHHYDYDYLVVGAGLSGATFARTVTDAGCKCLILEQRAHIGGNVYTEDKEGIHLHKYGPHIFHTNSEQIWHYVQQYARFNHFSYRPKAYSGGRLFSFPINLLTLHQLWGVNTPHEAEARLQEVRYNIPKPANLEEWALSQMGEELYELFIRPYTEKHWRCLARELPASILKRIPMRLTFDDNYYHHKYQGIPEKGYTALVARMLEGIEVRCSCDFFGDMPYWLQQAPCVVYTGAIDRLMNYQYGPLAYRSLRFETERLEIADFQGAAVINYPDPQKDYTRIIEHKHFYFGGQPFTYITREYPAETRETGLPLYPVNTEANNRRYRQYQDAVGYQFPQMILTGRLAEYRYYNMDQVIARALKKARQALVEMSAGVR